MLKRLLGKWILPAIVLGSAVCASAQAGNMLPSAPSPAQQCGLKSLKVCAVHVAQDEVGIVTSPLHAPLGQLAWMLPAFGAATGLAVHFDTQAIHDLGNHPNREHRFDQYSTYVGLYGPFIASAAGYGIGTMQHHGYLAETAVLASEAMADADILGEGLNYAIDREGPQQDNARGELWPNGPKGWPNSPSMPSEHSMNVWAFARVVAGQYNGVATKALVYGVAASTSVSRVIAKQHFPSDVLVGSTLGWLIGGYVLHHRSLEHGSLIDLSAVQTPLGRGLQLQLNLNRSR